MRNTAITQALIEDYMQHNGYRLIANAGFNDAGSIFTRNDQALIFYGNSIEYKRRKMADKPHIINVLFKWETVATYKGVDFTEFNLMMLLDIMGAVKIKEVNKELRQSIMAENIVSQINEMYLQNPVSIRNDETALA